MSVAKMKKVLNLLIVCVLSFKPLSAVIITGTTVGPNFIREEGELKQGTKK